MQTSDKKLKELKHLLDEVENKLAAAKRILFEQVYQEQADGLDISPVIGPNTIVEGVFDGERMMGTDGIKYNVPPNYASKSKLVEGDILKLVIKNDGWLIFKQIGPVDRDRVVGTLVVDDSGNYAIKTDEGDTFRILTASVTYFKGEPGDEVAALVPKGQSTSWAAVENIMSSGR